MEGPIRNEKISCALCSGLFLLPTTYVTKSYAQKTWLDPRTFEITYDQNIKIKDPKKREKYLSEARKIVNAANYWRKVFANCERSKREEAKPFFGWKVILFFPINHGSPFQVGWI